MTSSRAALLLLALPLTVAPALPARAHAENDGLALTAVADAGALPASATLASATNEGTLSREDLERGLERLLLQRQTAGAVHIGQQTLALLGGVALGLLPWAWTTASGASTAWRFDLPFYPLIGAGLATTVGEFAWRKEGYELEALYQKVRDLPSGSALPVISEGLVKRIRAVLAFPRPVVSADERDKPRGTSQEKPVTPASASLTLSSMQLATRSSRGVGSDVLETMAAMSLNVLATGALSIGGGLMLNQVLNLGSEGWTTFFYSTLALGPLGSGAAALVCGDPRGALDRVTEVYRLTAVTAGAAATAGTFLWGPQTGLVLSSVGAAPIVYHALDGGYTAVREKWAREAAAALATGEVPVIPVKP